MRGRTVSLILLIFCALLISGCSSDEGTDEALLPVEALPDAGPDKKILKDLAVTLEGSSGWETISSQNVSYEWDFGDGSGMDSGKVVQHQYADTGTFEVTLTITNMDTGSTAADTVEVDVVDWEVLPVPITVGTYSIDNPIMAFLPDGKMVILDADTFELVKETEGSMAEAREFQYITTLTLDGDPLCWPWGSFLETVDSNTVLAGTACEILKTDLTTGSTVEIGTDLTSWDATLSNNTLYVSAGEFGSPAKLYSVDLTTGEPVDLVTDIPGASGGICLDDAGNIYTGNGYASGPSQETGEIRQFNLSDPPIWSWAADGTLVADVLSGNALIWVGNNTILVGGGDEFGSGEIDYFSAVDIITGIPIWTLDPDDPNDPSSSYAIKGDKTANMFSAIPWGGDYYVLPFEALGF